MILLYINISSFSDSSYYRLLQNSAYGFLCSTVGPPFPLGMYLCTSGLSSGTRALPPIMWDLLLLCVDSLVVACAQ